MLTKLTCPLWLFWLVSGICAQVDRPPELVSRTGGGGGGWANVSELGAAAKAGNPRAMALYGELQLAGDQVEKNVPAALELLKAAARLGEASAVFRLGRLYDAGGPLPVDRTRALGYFRAAAAGGIPEAFYNLGASYASGRGVKRDYAEGLAWMILATQNGVRSEGEKQLRARIESLKRTDWIQLAQRRSQELSKELASKTVIEWLTLADDPRSVTKPPTALAPSPLPRVAPAPLLTPSPAAVPVIPGPGLPKPEAIQLPEVAAPKPDSP